MTHTKEEWTIDKSQYCCDIIAEDRANICSMTSGHSEIDKANAKLIVQTPKAFIIIIESYIRMQIESNRNILFAITTDSMRASYVSYLANVLSIKSEQVQTKIEGFALLVGNNEISVDEAIKKATARFR